MSDITSNTILHMRKMGSLAHKEARFHSAIVVSVAESETHWMHIERPWKKWLASQTLLQRIKALEKELAALKQGQPTRVIPFWAGGLLQNNHISYGMH